jgi:hypothetical protein
MSPGAAAVGQLGGRCAPEYAPAAYLVAAVDCHARHVAALLLDPGCKLRAQLLLRARHGLKRLAVRGARGCSGRCDASRCGADPAQAAAAAAATAGLSA